MRNLKAALLITLSLALAGPVRAALVQARLADIGREARCVTVATTEQPGLSAAEHEALSAAQRVASPDLQQLRAGDVLLTDHDLQVIAIALLVIVVIAIII